MISAYYHKYHSRISFSLDLPDLEQIGTQSRIIKASISLSFKVWSRGRPGRLSHFALDTGNVRSVSLVTEGSTNLTTICLYCLYFILIEYWYTPLAPLYYRRRFDIGRRPATPMFHQGWESKRDRENPISLPPKQASSRLQLLPLYWQHVYFVPHSSLVNGQAFPRDFCNENITRDCFQQRKAIDRTITCRQFHKADLWFSLNPKYLKIDVPYGCLNYVNVL